jgi:hypothetical protein
LVFENSEVSPVESLVAVALMNPFNLRAFIPKEALPLASVLTLDHGDILRDAPGGGRALYY